jgi:hypothetical protein
MDALKTTAFYAMCGWCGHDNVNAPCYDYTLTDCAWSFAEAQVNNDVGINDDLIQVLCMANGWCKSVLLDEIDEKIILRGEEKQFT